MTKYVLEATTIATASKTERWAFVIEKGAREYEAAELETMLPGVGFTAAIETIEVISAKT